MKLERAPEYVTTAVVVLLSMVLAVAAGRLTGQGQANLIVTTILGAFAIALVLVLRGGIWMLIPTFWVLAGKVPILPLPFAVRDLVVLFTFGAFAALIALKVVRRKPRYEFVDLVALALLCYLASAFVRNPVGTYAMGSARVGGKPYFDAFIGILTYLVLVRCSLPPNWMRSAPLFFSLGPWIQASLGIITFNLPWTVPILSDFYTGINTASYDAQGVSNGSTGVDDRQSHLGYIASTVILVLCSYFRPISTFFPSNLGRFILLIFAAYMSLKSGHRASVLDFGMIFLVASYYHRGWRDVIRLSAVAVPIVLILVTLQGNVIELPKSGQRALSFLPGKWDPNAVADAEHSTEWRLEMWRTVLTTDKYIENKVLGDGFGFTLREYEAMMAANYAVAMGDQGQETALRVGTFHSGPLSTVRVIGYIGFTIYFLLLVLLMRLGASLIRRSKGTELFPVTLFVCLPIITEPLRFILIFGAFDVSLPNTLLNLGMLKLLSNSLADHEAKPIPQKGLKISAHLRPSRKPERAYQGQIPRSIS